ncbi:ATP-binding cassette sub-family C member 3-like [Sabethes cyaneus]|uniref:ATP-binding cassette sub-family C member 3-like n=1 Tax=Sabethes cyaneus TaxID=53552 RepID=UPI00237ECC8C|nr:ATP-binding cassette sub-family C member 3-like [Sabethes cyaneus]
MSTIADGTRDQLQTFLYACVYLPQHMFLWILLLSEIRYYRRHTLRKDIRSNLTNRDFCILATKGVLSVILIVFVIFNVGRPGTHAATRLIETFSYFAALSLLHQSVQYNVRDQTFLLCFWSLELLINCIRVVDRISLGGILFIALQLALLLLLVYPTLLEQDESPPIQPNWIRQVCFTWFACVHHKIRHSKPDDELGEPTEELQCHRLIQMFRTGGVSRGEYDSIAVNEPPSLPNITLWNLLKPFVHDFVWTGANRLVLIIFFFVCPFLLRQILRSDESTASVDKHSYVISILFVSLVIAVLNGQYLYESQKIGLKIKSLVLVMIYEKSLKLKTLREADVTLLTLDSSGFVDLVPNLHVLWSGPIIIIVSVVGLVTILGRSAWIGVLTMIITICLTKKITEKLRLLQKDLMSRKDPRISSTNDVVGMMKQVKFFCWESIFQRRILQYRHLELQVLRQVMYWDAPKYLLGIITPLVVSLATFAVMLLIGHVALLTLESLFVSIVLFNILKNPLSVLPHLSSTWSATQASISRIREFLAAEEVRPLAVQKPEQRSSNLSETIEEVLGACRKTLDSPAICVQGAKLSSNEKVILSSIDLQIQHGSHIIVTGPVGSGKTSLLRAILGELSGGAAHTVGQIAYISQEPWILNRSFRENILFGQKFNQLHFENTIKACALVSDLNTFDCGLDTMIGEKGITVSGGQKQRISLARAVYQNADLYLLDDPLSSVDEEVSNHIYSKLFCEEGMLVGKTVVMVTQNKNHLRSADSILIMQNGRISETLTYESYRHKYSSVEKLITAKTIEADSLEITYRNVNRLAAGEKLVPTTKNKLSPKIYWSYFSMLGQLPLGTILLLNIAIPILDIYSTVWLSEWSTVDHQAPTTNNRYYLGIYGVFIIGLTLFLTLNSILTTVRGITVAEKLHRSLLQNIIHLPMTFFDRISSGQIMNRFSSDLDVVDSRIAANFRDFVTSLSSVIAILILFCCATSYSLVIVLAAILTPYYYLLVYHLETSRQLKHLEADSKAALILHFNESREGRSTIRAYQQEHHFLRDFCAIVDRHQHYSQLYIASGRWLGLRLELIGAVVIYFVTLMAVHNQKLIGASNVGVSISYAFRLIPLLNALIRVSALLEENGTSLDRINQYLKENDEDKCAGKNYQQVDSAWPEQGKIEFIKFNMNYNNHCYALQDITITVEAQEKIGIVGRTGAGKSSLISALFRLYPLLTNGTILIDGINIDRIPLNKLRSRLSIIPQNPSLFPGTVRENLDPNGEQSNDHALWRVLESCHLKQLIASYPGQLDARIDERNAKMSVGQKQLLYLARGILRNSKVVILDEATSAMDVHTENRVQQVIQSTFRHCTVLTIAHRKNTIQLADRVLHMQQGRVVKFDKLCHFDERDLMEL